jgi:hypothetical protein
MSRIGAAAVTIILLAATACHDSTAPAEGDSSIEVVNATLDVLDVTIDGRRMTYGGLSMNGLTPLYGVPAGVHHVRIDVDGQTPVSTEVTIDTKRFVGQMLVVYPSGSGPSAPPATTVLVDSSTYNPNGKSHLRVANLAAGAGAIDIWRSQPGSAVGTRIVTPFPSGTASPFLEGDPGVWEVWTTAAGSATKTASSGPIEIPDYFRRTVLVLDSPAGPRFVVVAH